AAAEDLDFSIGFHEGASSGMPTVGVDRFEGRGARHIISHTMEMMLACMSVIWGGVCERHPKIRIAFLESGGGWIAPWLDRMDRHFDDQGFNDSGLTTRPSELFQRNCWITFEPVEGSIKALADYIGPHKILWATDYPHPDGFFPGAPKMIMDIAVQDDMFTPEVIADPYGYYGRLRDEDPVHWNDIYALWVLTRHDDVTWMTRHNELFSSAVFRNDPRPAYPAIDESDLGLYEYVRNYQADQFIQHDRPEHLDMRKIVHGYFTPKAMESWRPFVVNAVKELLDAAEEKGSMDVMRDLATPLPVLVIAQMMGVPAEDRPY